MRLFAGNAPKPRGLINSQRAPLQAASSEAGCCSSATSVPEQSGGELASTDTRARREYGGSSPVPRASSRCTDHRFSFLPLTHLLSAGDYRRQQLAEEQILRR